MGIPAGLIGSFPTSAGEPQCGKYGHLPASSKPVRNATQVRGTGRLAEMYLVEAVAQLVKADGGPYPEHGPHAAGYHMEGFLGL